MSQGCSESPGFFSVVVNKVLHTYPNSVSFVDDLYLYEARNHSSRDDGAPEVTFQDHLDHIRSFFERLRKLNVLLNPQKTILFAETYTCLGFIINKNVVMLPPSKKQDLADFPLPNKAKMLTAFLASINYYKFLIPNLSNLTADLYEAANTKGRFKMSPKLTKDFLEIQKQLRDNDFTVRLPDCSTGYIVVVDSSSKAVGCRILQRDKNDPTKVVLIGCYGRKYSSTELRYDCYKKEVIGLMSALHSYAHLLRYSVSLEIWVDAKSILYLKLAKSSSPTLVRLALNLSNYQFTLNHLSSGANLFSDTLSRMPQLITKTKPKYRPLSQSEAIQFLQQLVLPETLQIPKDLVHSLLTTEGLYSNDIAKPKKESKQEPISKTKLLPPLYKQKENKMPRNARTGYRKIPQETYIKAPEVNLIKLESASKMDANSLIVNSKLVESNTLTLKDFQTAQEDDEFLCQIRTAKKCLQHTSFGKTF